MSIQSQIVSSIKELGVIAVVLGAICVAQTFLTVTVSKQRDIVRAELADQVRQTNKVVYLVSEVGLKGPELVVAGIVRSGGTTVGSSGDITIYLKRVDADFLAHSNNTLADAYFVIAPDGRQVSLFRVPYELISRKGYSDGFHEELGALAKDSDPPPNLKKK